MSETPPPAPPVPVTDTASPYAPAHSPSRRRSGAAWLYNIVIPLAILAVAGGIFWAFGKSTAPQRTAEDASLAGRMQRLPRADVQRVKSLEEVGGRLDLSVDGVVVPFREVQVATEVAGTIVYKDPSCEAGNYVEADQLLFRIDDRDYQLEVKRLARVREQEYQALQELDQEVANAQRLLDVASEDLQLRTEELKRLEELPSGFASKTELDALRRARLQAVQAQVTARNQLELLAKRRTRLEASERLAAVQLEAAELNLQRTEIRSPVSGVIVREDAELNSFVQRGSPIITIEDTSKVEVSVNLRMDQLFWVLDQADASAQTSSTESLALAAREGYQLPATDATIRYRVSGREDVSYQWQGTLIRYDGIGLDEQTRTAPVRIVVDNPKRFRKPDGSQAVSSGPTALLRGMFVDVTLHIHPQTPLVLVPALAMQPGNRVWHFRPDPAVLEPKPKPEPETTETGSAAEAQLVADKPRPQDRDPADKPGSDKPAGEQSAAEDLADRAPEFDVHNWVAGSVRVVTQVRAIETAEALHPGEVIEDLPQPPDSGAAGPATGLTNPAEDEYWICEIVDRSLVAGDLVVVSPLTAITSDQSVAVRVPVDQAEADAAPDAVTAQR
ncbi:efflux RND transporter periplasmic adaptor subunit [Roseimaritima sediminicola]|uniref:efflux RND transporter periplasmic adaptor subunit n=1 Tax=Roseimaritima sediminicola TaxID=2662066 RepID=UPI00129852D2|nr:efflux RND transporter periplasmic adaptor subunit [Roseimaritima sediminicola]